MRQPSSFVVALLILVPLNAQGATPAPATRPASPPARAAAATTRPAAPAARPAAATTRPAAPASRPAAVTALPADRPATMEELKQLFAEENYPDTLKGIARVLALRGKAAEPYDKYDLLMLRAECFLRTKANAAAASALAQAAKAAEDAKQDQKAAVAKADLVLLKESKNLAYAPRHGKGTPIDIVDPASRKKAMKALLSDAMAEISPKVDKALDGRSLAPIAEALRSLQGLDVLEKAVGQEEESEKLMQDLRERGNALMGKALQRMGRNVEEIGKSANELVENRYVVPLLGGGSREEVRLHKRGLSRQDQDDLKSIINTCKEIGPNALGLAEATGGRKRDVESLVDAADEVRRKAERVLDADYSY